MLKAYVIAGTSVDCAMLTSLLSNLGASSSSISAGVPLGPPGVETVLQEIQSADFTVVVVGAEGLSDNALIELGIAVGASKTLALFVHESADVPVILSNFLYVKYGAIGDTAMRFGLSNIISGLKRSIDHRPKEVFSDTGPLSGTIGAEMKAELEQIRQGLLIERNSSNSAGRAATGYRFEEFIGRVLKHCASQIVGQGYDADHGWDYALWDSSLSGKIGGPLTVEVKLSIKSRSVEAAALGQMRKAMLTTKTRISMVVYLDGPTTGNVTDFPKEGLTILFVPADMLVIQLENSDLASFISNFIKIHKRKADA